MAFKHYQGTPRPTVAPWVCPTCRAQNTGPLESGCTSCHAGADARPAPPSPAPPTPLPVAVGHPAGMPATSALPGDTLVPGAGSVGRASPAMERAFASWLVEVGGVPDDQIGLAAVAFLAGARWAQAQEDAVAGTVAVMERGPSTAALQFTPDARATIAAALRFYVENTLAYAPVLGQLPAAQARDLADTFDGGLPDVAE